MNSFNTVADDEACESEWYRIWTPYFIQLKQKEHTHAGPCACFLHTLINNIIHA